MVLGKRERGGKRGIVSLGIQKTGPTWAGAGPEEQRTWVWIGVEVST